jgi:hypothetical protein
MKLKKKIIDDRAIANDNLNFKKDSIDSMYTILTWMTGIFSIGITILISVLGWKFNADIKLQKKDVEIQLKHFELEAQKIFMSIKKKGKKSAEMLKEHKKMIEESASLREPKKMVLKQKNDFSNEISKELISAKWIREVEDGKL